MSKGCIKIHIASGIVSSDLTNFPVYLNISGSAGLGSTDLTDIFDVLDASNLKMRLYNSTFSQQCYVEIVSWSTINNYAEIHFKAPYIYASSDTDYYLLYDTDYADNSDYVGVTGSTPAKNVWDNNFVAVYHMNDSGSDCLDSTQYSNTAAKINSPSEGAGLVGRCQSFNGVSQYLLTSHSDSLNCTSGTLETLLKAQNVDTDGYLFAKGDPSVGYYYNNRFVGSINRTEWAAASAVQSSDVFTDSSTWVLSQLTFDTVNLNFYRNGSSAGSGSLSTAPVNNTDGLYIANRKNGSTAAHFFDGSLDEVRVSNSVRNSAWEAATYINLFDTLNTYSLIDSSVITNSIRLGFTSYVTNLVNYFRNIYSSLGLYVLFKLFTHKIFPTLGLSNISNKGIFKIQRVNLSLFLLMFRNFTRDIIPLLGMCNLRFKGLYKFLNLRISYLIKAKKGFGRHFKLATVLLKSFKVDVNSYFRSTLSKEGLIGRIAKNAKYNRLFRHGKQGSIIIKDE